MDVAFIMGNLSSSSLLLQMHEETLSDVTCELVNDILQRILAS